MIQLRDYQRASLDALYAWFRANPAGNPLLILPTGAGKAILIAALIQEALTQWPKTRILMVTHSRDLIAQNAQKLISMWPQAPIGIHSAGLRKRDVYQPVIFAGIQSIWKKAMHLGTFDLILIDEVHLVSHKAEGTYRAFLADCRKINPNIRIIGLTATPFRSGHGSLMHGDDAMFHDVAYQIKMLDLIAQGYLSPLVSKRMATQLDVSGVAIKQGEFAAGQLERAVDQEAVTEAALDECEEYGKDRKKWLVFCAGVAHAEHVAEAMNARGIKTGCITGKTPNAQRDRLIADYRAGRLRALSSMGVLTTGFDVPDTDMLVLLRPTQSPGLYVQMIGRGSRIAPGKVDCLVLDFAGNAMRHGPVDQIEAWTPHPTEGEGDAPCKTCPECQTIAATAVRICPICGYEFPFDEKPKHEARASDAPILSTDLAPRLERHEVHGVSYQEWPGRDTKPPTLRVDYRGPMMRIASEWVCLEHEGYARTKAVLWWLKRAPGTNAPRTIDEALNRLDELSEPSAIVVNTLPKYPEIASHEFESKPENRNAQRPESGASRMQLGA